MRTAGTDPLLRWLGPRPFPRQVIPDTDEVITELEKNGSLIPALNWYRVGAASLHAQMDHEKTARLCVRLTTETFEVARRSEKRSPAFRG